MKIHTEPGSFIEKVEYQSVKDGDLFSLDLFSRSVELLVPTEPDLKLASMPIA